MRALNAGIQELSDWEMLSLQEALVSLDHTTSPPFVENFVCLAQQCRQKRNMAYAKQVHLHIHANGLEALDMLGNYLVPMFVVCRSVPNAQQVFLRLEFPNEHSWNFLIHGYVECGELKHALKLFRKMQEDCIHANMYTCQALLKACARLNCVEKGQEVHFEIVKEGFERDTFIGSTLLAMYAKCGFLIEARDVFDELQVRDVVSWTALIAGYAEHGLSEEVLNCLEKMQTEGVCLDAVTLVCSLKGCGSIGAIGRGQEIHAEVVKEGFEEDILVGSTLVDMYAKCRCLVEAQDVFDELSERNVVTWNTLVNGYAEHGHNEEALDCLEKMKLDGMSPDLVTFMGSLKACSSVGTIDRGREIHTDIVKGGLERDLVLGSTLMDMYTKCDSLVEAQAVFDKLLVHDVVSWTAIMAGYVEHGLSEDMMNCYEQMQLEGVSPNALTLLCILKACGSMCTLAKGQYAHVEITKKGFERDLLVGSSLLDMYAKCGSLAEAHKVFDDLPVRDVVSWSSIIAGYAAQGQSEVVFQMFERMRDESILPGEVAFLAVLTVCSHAGFVDKGQKYFKMMTKDYNITPTIEHHNCMADLLGRSGQLNEAAATMEKMAFKPNFVTWSTVLGACQKWGSVDLGQQAFDNATRLDEKDDATFVLMSNIYALEGYLSS